jgi:hypothetical protein
MSNQTESLAEKPEAVVLLRRLLGRHFYIDDREGLTWSWQEGVGLADVEPTLDAALREYYERADPFMEQK